MVRKKIKLFYYKSEPNFGDELNVCLLRDLFGIHATYANKKKCKYVCIGSLLQSFITNKTGLFHKIKRNIKPSVHIWGTGFIQHAQNDTYMLARKMKIHALRGKLSLERMQEYAPKTLNNVVLGDPGLLANRLIDQTKIKKKSKLGIIPHYVDKNNTLLKNIDVENSIIIDVQQPVMTVLKQIAQCENIISSAMHGLIVSDSLGIPNIRMILSDKIIGGDYKFQDYYSAFDMKMPTPVIINSDTKITNIDFIKRHYKISETKVEKICRELKQSFPYK